MAPNNRSRTPNQYSDYVILFSIYSVSAQPVKKVDFCSDHYNHPVRPGSVRLYCLWPVNECPWSVSECLVITIELYGISHQNSQTVRSVDKVCDKQN